MGFLSAELIEEGLRPVYTTPGGNILGGIIDHETWIRAEHGIPFVQRKLSNADLGFPCGLHQCTPDEGAQNIMRSFVATLRRR